MEEYRAFYNTMDKANKHDNSSESSYVNFSATDDVDAKRLAEHHRKETRSAFFQHTSGWGDDGMNEPETILTRLCKIVLEDLPLE